MGLPGLLLWLGLVGSVLAQVRRRRARLEADDRTIQALWIQRAVIGFLVAGLFASYSAITMFYLFLGILWSASNLLGRDASQPGAPPTRRVRSSVPRLRGERVADTRAVMRLSRRVNCPAACRYQKRPLRHPESMACSS